MNPTPSLESFFNTAAAKRFFCPTRLFWGAGTRELAPEALAGARRVLLVVDASLSDHPEVGRLAARVPVVHRVVVAGEPDSTGIEALLDGLPPEVDGLLCIGGGSTMDTGKALRAHLAYGTWAVKDRPACMGMPRLVAVPTVPASGSEMSRYYVVADGSSHEKRSYRSWSLAPDVALLDPIWMDTLPASVRFAGAFDAFTHLYESLLCRQERSWINEALCREGLTRLMALAPALLSPEPLAVDEALGLQYAAALGGIALSNVRTGLLHDAGEALAAQVDLPHPLTLRVFFPALLDLHRPVLAERFGPLALGPGGAGDPAGLPGWRTHWLEGFRTWGLEDQITGRMRGRTVDQLPLVAKVLSDRVLIEKETPVPLDEATIRAFVAQGLASFSTGQDAPASVPG